MIQAIICKQGKRTWVCGIFESVKKAMKYKDRIDEKLNPRIVETICDNYPLFIIEDNREFEFVEDEFAIEIKKQKIKKIKDFDDSYFAYYIIDQDFSFKPAGVDLMGSLEHYHVTNRDL